MSLCAARGDLTVHMQGQTLLPQRQIGESIYGCHQTIIHSPN